MLMMNDQSFLARAFTLARRGIYTTDPNPRVGCVIARDGEILGEGFHQSAGDDHAEVIAIENASVAQLEQVWQEAKRVQRPQQR